MESHILEDCKELRENTFNLSRSSLPDLLEVCVCVCILKK